jgi:hypothetical protein
MSPRRFQRGESALRTSGRSGPQAAAVDPGTPGTTTRYDNSLKRPVRTRSMRAERIDRLSCATFAGGRPQFELRGVQSRCYAVLLRSAVTQCRPFFDQGPYWDSLRRRLVLDGSPILTYFPRFRYSPRRWTGDFPKKQPWRATAPAICGILSANGSAMWLRHPAGECRHDRQDAYPTFTEVDQDACSIKR